MRIAILVEGRTEKAFKPFLSEFLKQHLPGKMPHLDFVPQDGGIPTEGKLKRVVEGLLNAGSRSADAVIALTDVYTGSNPPLFENAADAKRKMSQWVGPSEKFHPHCALHDFEAWLIPYWAKIQKLARSNRTRPGSNPEMVNHGNPPAYRLKEIYKVGDCRKDYSKVIDAPRILRGEDLMVSIRECAEFRAFVNRILTLCGGTTISD